METRKRRRKKRSRPKTASGREPAPQGGEKVDGSGGVAILGDDAAAVCRAGRHSGVRAARQVIPYRRRCGRWGQVPNFAFAWCWDLTPNRGGMISSYHPQERR